MEQTAKFRFEQEPPVLLRLLCAHYHYHHALGWTGVTSVMAHSGLLASVDAAPGAAPVRAPQERATGSHGDAGTGTRAGHATQPVGRAARLAAPGAAPVRAPQERAAASHGHAGARARAGHAMQVAERAADLAACGRSGRTIQQAATQRRGHEH